MREARLGFICPMCHNIHTVDVNSNDYIIYMGGGLAKNVFPYLTATEKEQIISHTCPICQKKILQK